MKRHLAHVAQGGQQGRQYPRIQRRMRMPAHIHQVALKQIARVIRMQRLDLRMLGGVQVISIVALDGLMEERQAQRQHDRNDQRNPRYHWTGTPGLSVHTWVPGMSRSSSANCS